MVKPTKQKVVLIISALLLILLIKCANQLPPGGGPVDTTPPEIISSYPANGTVNFKDDYIQLEFSEYVDKSSFHDAIFISPSFGEQLFIDWGGTGVQVTFPNGLKEDVTYVITIGTDVVDVNNKNRMAHSYSFSFSTGDKIDKRTIRGKVFGENTEGTLIFAYKFVDDTTSYLSHKPDYLSQIGKDGDYKLEGLAESVYRIFAVKDQLKDFIYQPEQDLIGIPFKDISLIGTDSSFAGMDFFINQIDTLSPRMISATMLDRNHILVTLSEECDSSILNGLNYFIYDSTNNKKLDIAFAYKGNTKKEEMLLAQSNELNNDDRYYLISQKLTDLSRNEFYNDWKELIVSDRPDTTAPKLFRKNPEQFSSVDFIKPSFTFSFDDAISNKQVKNYIKFEDTLKNKIPFNIKFTDDATLNINPLDDLKPDRKFSISIDLSKFQDINGNKIDSIYTYKFSTISGIEFTGLSGRVNKSEDNIVLVLQNDKNKKLAYPTKPDKTNSFDFTRITAGTYNLWYYFDKDSNNIYDCGSAIPFRYAEEFHFYPDTVKLKARWSMTDLNLNIKWDGTNFFDK